MLRTGDVQALEHEAFRSNVGDYEFGNAGIDSRGARVPAEVRTVTGNPLNAWGRGRGMIWSAFGSAGAPSGCLVTTLWATPLRRAVWWL